MVNDIHSNRLGMGGTGLDYSNPHLKPHHFFSVLHSPNPNPTSHILHSKSFSTINIRVYPSTPSRIVPNPLPPSPQLYYPNHTPNIVPYQHPAINQDGTELLELAGTALSEWWLVLDLMGEFFHPFTHSASPISIRTSRVNVTSLQICTMVHHHLLFNPINNNNNQNYTTPFGTNFIITPLSLKLPNTTPSFM